MTRRPGLVLTSIVLVLAGSRAVDACSCTEFLSFEESARDAPVVVIGKVVAQQKRGGWQVAYLEVVVQASFKGGVAAGTTIRAWDPAFRSMCSINLRVHEPRTSVALALHPARGVKSGLEALKSMDDEDYLLYACRESHKSVPAGRYEATGEEIRRALASP